MKIHNLEYAKEQFDKIVEEANAHGFKRAHGPGRRTGGSFQRNNLSQYEYINTRAVFKCKPLITAVKNAAKEINIFDHMLVSYILQLQPKDFLDIQDYWKRWESKEATAVKNSSVTFLGKFFSVSLTDDNYIILERDGILQFREHVPKYHAIEFHPTTVHCIPAVTDLQTWMVYMVPTGFDL